MTWRMAKSLEILLAQINELFPGRDKSSDGGIGNAEHSARTSDHNPNDAGIVCARDFTHDPARGLDSEALANALLASRDPRIKYIISNKKIASGAAGPSPWKWRPYTGANPHNHHCHVSVSKQADSVKAWVIDLKPMAETVAPAQAPDPVLHKGDKGESVVHLQVLLNAKGCVLKEDGDFGNATKAAVEIFQTKSGLVADGIVGGYTWRALRA